MKTTWQICSPFTLGVMLTKQWTIDKVRKTWQNTPPCCQADRRKSLRHQERILQTSKKTSPTPFTSRSRSRNSSSGEQCCSKSHYKSERSDDTHSHYSLHLLPCKSGVGESPLHCEKSWGTTALALLIPRVKSWAVWGSDIALDHQSKVLK